MRLLEVQEKYRRNVGRVLRELRLSRHWTQAQLSERLGLSQGHLSQIEHGERSLSAEQLLVVLQLFNVAASRFVEHAREDEKGLQNALARLGASHLREDEKIMVGEGLEELNAAIRSSLVSASPRLLTALGPVIVNNVDEIGFSNLRSRLAEIGFERRLDWLLDNVREAVRHLARDEPKSSRTKTHRRVLVVLDNLLADRERAFSLVSADRPEDILDRTIRSKQTLDEVREASSPISKRWGVVSSLHVDDFVTALKDSNVLR